MPSPSGGIFRDLFCARSELNNNMPAWISLNTGSETLLGSQDVCGLAYAAVVCPGTTSPVPPVPGQHLPVPCQPLRSDVHPQMGERAERARRLN